MQGLLLFAIACNDLQKLTSLQWPAREVLDAVMPSNRPTRPLDAWLTHVAGLRGLARQRRREAASRGFTGVAIWCQRERRCVKQCARTDSGLHRSMRIASSHSRCRSLAGERRTCSITKPDFVSTRMDAPLVVAAAATSGRLATSRSNR